MLGEGVREREREKKKTLHVTSKSSEIETH